MAYDVYGKTPATRNVRRVLSLSMGDIHAVAALPELVSLPDIVTGSGFGGMYALLFAAGCEPQKILDVLRLEGYRIGKGGKRITPEQIRYFLAHDDILGKDGIREMQIKDLKCDCWFEIVNASHDIPGVISKDTAPEMYVAAACCLIMAHPVFTKPLKLSASQTATEQALTEKGCFYGAYAYYPVPDLRLVQYFKGTEFVFETFWIQYEKLRKKKLNNAGYQLDTSHDADGSTVVQEMATKLGKNYRLRRMMEKKPFVMNLDKSNYSTLCDLALNKRLLT